VHGPEQISADENVFCFCKMIHIRRSHVHSVHSLYSIQFVDDLISIINDMVNYSWLI